MTADREENQIKARAMEDMIIASDIDHKSYLAALDAVIYGSGYLTIGSTGVEHLKLSEIEIEQ